MVKFKEGDVVILKSGGPKMTVQSYHELNDKRLTAVWFEKSDQKAASFMEDMLDLDE